MTTKTFRTAKSTSKYTAKYCVSYDIDNQPSKVIFLESLREVRTMVAQLKEQGYTEEKTSLSLTL